MITLPIACGIDGTLQPWDPQYAEVSKDGASLILYPGLAGALRPNMIQNGDFATDTIWSKQAGWTISGGAANISGQVATRNLNQVVSGLVQGGQYEVVFTVLNYVTGGVTPAFAGSGVDAGTLRTANGTYTQTITITNASPSVFRFTAEISSSLSVDTVSVKRVA